MTRCHHCGANIPEKSSLLMTLDFCNSSCFEKWQKEYKSWLDMVNANNLEAERLLGEDNETQSD